MARSEELMERMTHVPPAMTMNAEREQAEESS
jgi:hypothetical protein